MSRRHDRGWHLTDDGMDWLMLSEFFESVNGDSDAMRVHVHKELEAAGKTAAPLPSGPGLAACK